MRELNLLWAALPAGCPAAMTTIAPARFGLPRGAIPRDDADGSHRGNVELTSSASADDCEISGRADYGSPRHDRQRG